VAKVVLQPSRELNNFLFLVGVLAKKYKKKEVKIQTPIEYRNKNGRLQIVFV
jgi:hypothetical protein